MIKELIETPYLKTRRKPINIRDHMKEMKRKK